MGMRWLTPERLRSSSPAALQTQYSPPLRAQTRIAKVPLPLRSVQDSCAVMALHPRAGGYASGFPNQCGLERCDDLARAV